MDIPKWDGWPHVLRMPQFSRENFEQIIYHALCWEDALRQDARLPRLSKRTRQANGCMRYRHMRTLFYEPSTRTQATFHDAMTLLRCSVQEVADPSVFSSAVKGESLQNAIAAYMGEADGIIMRHKEEGASRRAAEVVDTLIGSQQRKRPFMIINAGDGMDQHPTQAFVDMTTIKRKRGARVPHFMDDLTVLFPGDLARSRVVNSLLYSLGKFAEHRVRALFCCPPGLEPSEGILLYLRRHGVAYDFVSMRDFPDAIRQADVVYMTRVQRERKVDGVSVTVEAKVRTRLAFRKEYAGLLKSGAFVMHPLPINEDPGDPPPEIDSALMPLALSGDERFAWIDQSYRGIPVRAALLDLYFAGCDAGYMHLAV